MSLDSEGKITMLNRKGREILGWLPEEAIGLNWFASCLPQPQGMTEIYQTTQGAVVSNKLLSCILGHIKDKQATKDAEGLKKARTKRDKRLLLQRIKATG